MPMTRMTVSGAAAVLLLGTTAFATGGTTYTAPSQDTALPGAAADIAPHGAVSDHVIVISIDGLRPDAIETSNARVLKRLMSQGAYSLNARTISPSKTLPSHTSMLTGVPPAVHGVTWNSDQTAEHGYVTVETVFELARRDGFRTAAFVSKAKLRHLLKPGTLDHAQAPGGLDLMSAAATVEQASRYMQFRRPNLLFVHLAEPDAAGHSIGWMSFAYRWAVRRADAAVGKLLERADRAYGAGNYTVIVTADHGGAGRTHGQDSDVEMLIPWIAWGAGVASGEVAGPVSTMDTAATVLWLLGVSEPDTIVGTALAAAYTPAARVAAAATMAAAR